MTKMPGDVVGKIAVKSYNLLLYTRMPNSLYISTKEGVLHFWFRETHVGGYYEYSLLVQLNAVH
jgi:VanZ family protein